MPRCATSDSRCSRRTSTSRSSRTSSPGSASERSATRCSRACRPGSRSSRSSTTSWSRSCRAGDRTFHLSGNPAVVAMVGLQGSGKTTSSAKLARHVVKLGRRPLLVAADPYRPAAADQLETLGKSLDIPVYRAPVGTPVVDIVRGRRRGGQAPGPRRRDPRYRRPALGRRGADGRDRRRQRRGQTGRDAARGRCHDRPGGRRGRPGVRGRRAGHRPRPDQDRRRCARRCGALDLGGDRDPGQVPRHRARRPTRSRSSTRTGSPAGSSGWATS